MGSDGFETVLFALSFLGVAGLAPSSVLGLTFTVLPTADEGSFFLTTPLSAGFFFTLSTLTLVTSGFTFTLAFTILSFFVLSVFKSDLVVVFPVLLDGALAAVLDVDFEDMGGVLVMGARSSIGSSRTGVASPRSMA